MIKKILFFVSILVGGVQFVSADTARDALVDLGVSAGLQKKAESEASLIDGKAYVYRVNGKAVLTKSGSPVEAQVKVGDLIQPGDKIITEKNASVAIAFDYMKKNAVQIPSESQAVFNSIEPTDIKLEDGTVFSAVDGLVKGSAWKVTTPAAVAAVRGTVYLVTYEASNGDFFAATVDVPDDGKTSAIEIQPLDGKGEAFVPEGKEISLREGQEPNNEMVQDLKPEVVAEIKQFFEGLKSERTESDKAGGNNNGGNGPSGPSGPNSSGGTPGNANTGSNPPANPFTTTPNLSNPKPGMVGAPGAGTNPAGGINPPAGVNPPGFMTSPNNSSGGGNTFSAPMANSAGSSGLSGFMPETMKMDGMGAGSFGGPNSAGGAGMTMDTFGSGSAGGYVGANTMDGMSSGPNGVEGPGMIDAFGPGPAGSFDGPMDTFSGPPGGEFGTFAGGGGFMPTGGANLPPLDQTTLPGSTIFNNSTLAQYCDSNGCYPKTCTSGTSC